MKTYQFQKFVYLFICLFVYWIIAPRQPARAAGEFSANYDVSYAIAPSGVTIVTQTVSLVNLQTNLYPKQYTILLDTINVRNIIARDDGGTVTPAITQRDGKTEILLTFNKQIVGLGKQTTFTLRYENLDIAKKNGSIWEVNIPGIEEDPDLGAYSVTIQTPPTFGQMSFLKPLPEDGMRWNRDQMVAGGISAAYGEKQTAKLSLRYYLANPGVRSVRQDIALPPETAFQAVIIDSLNPKPDEMFKDDDGNWLARYSMSAGQNISIEAVVTVTIELPSRMGRGRSATDSGQLLAPEERARLLTAQPYWETDNAKIKELAGQYKTPQEIYAYVVRTLSYDYERVNTKPKRKGAVATLEKPGESICMEFTDLFIAIARAAGIPAREVVGHAHTTNAKLRPLSLVTDVLHAWPEYYDDDRRMWIPADPTWGSTTGGVDYFSTLDFNHIVFAIHGLSSSLPLPAGFYREDGKEGNDIRVEFLGSPASPVTASLTPGITFPSTVTAGFGGKGMVTVANTSGVEARDVSVRVDTDPPLFTLVKDHQTILPYSTLVIPVAFSVPSRVARSDGSIRLTVGDKTAVRSFTIQPISWLYLSLSGMIGSAAILLWIAVFRPFSKKTNRK
jgi:hypothetical protein